MFKKLSLAGATAAIAAAALVPSAPAAAQSYRGGYERGYDNRGYGYDNGYGYDRGYRNQAYNGGYRNNYRGYNYQAPRGCSDGASGTIIGAIAGGLLGNTVAGRGDRAAGTILGGVLGAVAGRAIDKSGQQEYCRNR